MAGNQKSEITFSITLRNHYSGMPLCIDFAKKSHLVAQDEINENQERFFLFCFWRMKLKMKL